MYFEQGDSRYKELSVKPLLRTPTLRNDNSILVGTRDSLYRQENAIIGL